MFSIRFNRWIVAAFAVTRAGNTLLAFGADARSSGRQLGAISL